MIGEAFELMSKNPLPGCLCEFGVWQGAGLEGIEKLSHTLGENIPVYGFDSFEGMPPTAVELTNDHKIDWVVGRYSDTSLEAVQARVPRAKLIKAVFHDLKPLAEYGIDRVRFARMDCDIYEGYYDALRLLTPHVQVGTYLLFDEGVAPPDPRYHDSIRDSGERAIREWQETSGIKLKMIHSRWTECLTKVEVMP